jgi:hypothetical protein
VQLQFLNFSKSTLMWKHTALLILSLSLAPANAYISTGLPAHKHRAFLRKLTDDICNTSPGSLSPEVCQSTAPMLLRGWASAPDKLQTPSFNGKERALAVECLLKRMIDERHAGNEAAVVKTQDYNSVMKSWVISGAKSAAAVRVEEILRRMQKMYESGDEDVKPDLDSFITAIEAWTKADDDVDAPRQAQRILEWMSNLYLSGKNDLAAPDVTCFHLVFKSWAGSKKLESPIMIEQLIMWMQHLQSSGISSLQPDTMCFNIAMSAWLKSDDLSSEKRIREIFEYMDRAYRSGHTDFKPDAGTYNIVISSISPAVKKYYDSCAARRADKILGRLERGFIAGDESLRPDTIVYNQVIDYWAKTQSVRGYFLKARDVLDRQLEMYSRGIKKCKPDVMSYTSVIAACASTYGTWDEKKRAFELAHKTFMECCEDVGPNDVTYGIMFKAVGRLIQNKNERDRYARTLFGLTCDDGCLGEMAFSRFQDAVSKKLFDELTDGVGAYTELPAQWKQNVPRKKAEPKKTARKTTTSKQQLAP